VHAGLRPVDRPGGERHSALIYQHATGDRDQAIATPGDLARQVRRATDDNAEEPHEKAQPGGRVARMWHDEALRPVLVIVPSGHLGCDLGFGLERANGINRHE